MLIKRLQQIVVIVALLLIGIGLLIYPPVSAKGDLDQVTKTIPNAVPTTKSALQELAKQTAIEHGLNVSRFLKVIECESSWNPKAMGDYRNGEPTSFGLAELHYPTRDWGIATSSAYVPEIALTIMAKAWEKNEQYRWSCYNNLYG